MPTRISPRTQVDDIAGIQLETAREALRSAGVKNYSNILFCTLLIKAVDPLRFAESIKKLENLKFHYSGIDKLTNIFASKFILEKNIAMFLSTRNNPLILANLISKINTTSSELLTEERVREVRGLLQKANGGRLATEYVEYVCNHYESIKKSSNKSKAIKVCNQLEAISKKLIQPEFIEIIVKSKNSGLVIKIIKQLANGIPEAELIKVFTVHNIKLVINNIQSNDIKALCNIILLLYHLNPAIFSVESVKRLITAENMKRELIQLLLGDLGISNLKLVSKFINQIIQNFDQLVDACIPNVFGIYHELDLTKCSFELICLQVLCKYRKESSRLISLITTGVNSIRLVARTKVLFLLDKLQPGLITEANLSKIFTDRNPVKQFLVILFTELKIDTSKTRVNELIEELSKNPEQLFLLINKSELSLAVSDRELSIQLLALDSLLTEHKARMTLKQALSARGGEQMAWRADKVELAKYTFSKIEERYNVVYNSEPYNGDLNKIEEEIRKTILDEIVISQKLEEEHNCSILRATKENTEISDEQKTEKLKQLSDDIAKNQEIISFITTFRQSLSSGKYNSLNRRARELFNSNQHLPIIAWRCYDKDAPWVEWPNLLTPNDNEAVKVYNGENQPKISLKSASDEARRLVALFYLANMDTSTEELADSKQWRISKFIAELAEVRRAHNENPFIGTIIDSVDNPSCLPGFYTRMADTVKDRRDLNILTTQEAVQDKIKALINLELHKIISSGSDDLCEEEKVIRLKQYYSCTVLGLSNAREILYQTDNLGFFDYMVGLPDMKLQITEALCLRQKFLAQFKFDKIFKQVVAYIKELEIPIDEDEIRYFIIRNLLDLSSVTPQLSLAQIARLMPVVESESDFEVATDDSFNSSPVLAAILPALALEPGGKVGSFILRAETVISVPVVTPAVPDLLAQLNEHQLDRQLRLQQIRARIADRRGLQIARASEEDSLDIVECLEFSARPSP